MEGIVGVNKIRNGDTLWKLILNSFEQFRTLKKNYTDIIFFEIFFGKLSFERYHIYSSKFSLKNLKKS